jgi:uncharacterized protein
MAVVNRPPVTPRGEEKIYFERLKLNELVYHSCENCQQVLFPLRQVCTGCASESLILKVSSGRGSVHSFTTQYRASHPFFADSVPFTLLLVDLEEGFRVLANLVDAGESDITIGSPVEAIFDHSEEDLSVLRFRLAPDQEARA